MPRIRGAQSDLREWFCVRGCVPAGHDFVGWGVGDDSCAVPRSPCGDRRVEGCRDFTYGRAHRLLKRCPASAGRNLMCENSICGQGMCPAPHPRGAIRFAKFFVRSGGVFRPESAAQSDSLARKRGGATSLRYNSPFPIPHSPFPIPIQCLVSGIFLLILHYV